MAVDANVLIFERIKEELKDEKNNLIAESIINLSKDQKEKNKTNYKNL